MVEGRTQFWSARVGRQQLVEILEGKGPHPERVDRISIPSAHDGLTAIWIGPDRTRLDPLPSTIVGAQSDLDELIAWSSTYLRGLGPIGALTRLITPDRLIRLMDDDVRPERPWRIAGGAVGLICGEIMAQLGTVDVASGIGANPVGTLSFAICRAWSLGASPSDLSEVASNYGILMRIMRRDLEPRRLKNIETIAGCLLGIPADRGHPSLRAMSDLLAGDDLYSVADQVLRLSTDLLAVHDASRLSEMTAEDKVQFFDAIAPSLTDGRSGTDDIDAGFALALAAFICRPGLEQQVGLLEDHARRVPTALLWLGAMQVLATTADVLSTGDGAGWKAARELYRADHPLAAPKVDVSISELAVLARGTSKVFEKLVSRPRLDVEIFPMIAVGVRGRSFRDATQEPTFSGPDPVRLRLVGTKLEQVLEMLKELSGNPAPIRKSSPKRRR